MNGNIRDILKQGPFDVEAATVLMGYRGSIAHGTHVQPDDPAGIDDKDVMGVFVCPVDYYFGLKRFEHLESIKGEWDVVMYDIRKFFSLLLKGNPNVLSLLWLEPNSIITLTSIGKVIVENRDLFVGRHIYHSFIGYAHGQLHRMTHIGEYKGYMGAKRKALVDKFGWDTKNGAHLIRLLRMGVEFLKDGRLYVLRQDAQELIEIKRGEWSLDRVKGEADRLFKLAQEMYLKSDLPLGPSTAGAERLLVECIRMMGELPRRREF